MKPREVYVYKTNSTSYPKPPFSPPEIYPELKKTAPHDLDTENQIYAAVRNLLIEMKLDEQNLGTENWSPFRGMVKQGDTVIIKPNFAYHKHPLGEEGSFSVTTHASVIRPLIDYLLLATNKDCRIIICDAPLLTAYWDVIIKNMGFDRLVEYYETHNTRISLVDLRYISATMNDYDVITGRFSKKDLSYCIPVDLGNTSELTPIIKHKKKFSITDYPGSEIEKHHNEIKNEYLIPKEILSAALFINVPKLKTHKKAGITVAMKNLIGINADKRCIIHHRRGGVPGGGDEYPQLKVVSHLLWKAGQSARNNFPVIGTLLSLVKRLYIIIRYKDKNGFEKTRLKGAKDIINEGSWHGNDTLWRCIIDINNILFYADKNGLLKEAIQRKYFCLVDGIIAGEGDGPVNPFPRPCGLLIAGTNPVAIDFACSRIMGFDWKKLPSIKHGFANRFFKLVDFTPEEVEIISNSGYIYEYFIPPTNWEQLHIK